MSGVIANEKFDSPNSLTIVLIFGNHRAALAQKYIFSIAPNPAEKHRDTMPMHM